MGSSFKYLLKLLGISVLGYLLYRTGWQKPLEMAKRIPLPFLGLILVLNLPHISCKAARWKLMLASNHCNYPFANALASYFSGIALGIITPGRAGEFLRALFVAKSHKIQLAQSLSTVIVDRIFDLAVLSTLSLAAFALFMDWKLAALGLAITGVGFYLITQTSSLWGHLIQKIANILKIKVENQKLFKKGLKKSFQNPLLLTLLSLAGYGFLSLQVFLLAHSMGIKISYLELTLLFSLANTFALLPISFMGLGTREAALGYLFTMVGFTSAQGITVALGFFFVVSLPVIITGALVLLFSRKTSGEHIEEALENGDSP